MGMRADLFIDKAPELVADHIKGFVFKPGFAKAAGIKAVLDLVGNRTPGGVVVARTGQGRNRAAVAKGGNHISRNAKG